MTKWVWGIAIAAVFAVGMIVLVDAFHGTPPRAGYVDMISTSSSATTLSMTVADDVKQISKKNALDVVTFWAWEVPGPNALDVVAVTIHHGVNDHQIGAPKSTPVQGFHPHYAGFDGAFCLVSLGSPVLPFTAKDHTVSVTDPASAGAWTGFAVTGTIGPRGDCAATGLGVTGVDDHIP